MVRSAGSTDMELVDISAALARINDCVKSKPKDEVESPLSKLGLPNRVINSLTEYEEHRLLENIKKNRIIYSIQVSFSLATFDQDLSELTELLKGVGEVISTLPSAGEGLESAINFEILFASDKSLNEIMWLVEKETNLQSTSLVKV